MTPTFLDINEGVPDDNVVNDAWLELGIDPAEVRSWIAAALPGRVLSTERAEVLNRKDWSLVALFAAREWAKTADVIYKATLLPDFRHGPAIFALLSRVCPGEVPHLLAWRETEGRVEMLFRPFSGVSVQAAGDIEPLLKMAGTLARIQSRIGATSPAETAGLPRLSVEQIPALLDGLLADISRTYAPYWDADKGALRKEFGLPDDLSDRLASFRPHLVRWSAALATLGPPDSLDHVDCLPHNAVVQTDGRVLIYDWEQATWGCPFFSIDILLAFAQNFAETSAASEVGQATLLLTEEKATPSAVALCHAYLEAFDWGTLEERENALDLALCFSPLRYAHAEGLLAARFGNERYQAEDLAWWLMRALRRWERMATREGLPK